MKSRRSTITVIATNESSRIGHMICRPATNRSIADMSEPSAFLRRIARGRR